MMYKLSIRFQKFARCF